MRLFERRTLIQFIRRHADARGPLLAWAKEIENARYENPAQLRQRHGSADFVGDKVVFDVGGNKYRLVTQVRYARPKAKPPLNGMVLVRFLGTQEYDRIDVSAL